MKIGFVELELIFTAIWLSVRLAVWIKNRRIDLKREALLLLMYVNLAVIIRFVFFPMEEADGKIQPLVLSFTVSLPDKINLIPLANIMRFDTQRDMLLNIVGNTVMFIPGGIILPILYKKLNSFWKVTFAGFLISLCIEILQLPIVSRGSDVDDLILNTLGVMIGYGIYALFKKLISFRRTSEKKS